jgi:Flp pilus assembly pilin Flp
MFTLFRYGLIPVVLLCAVVIAAGVQTVSTNVMRKSSWPQTVVTVTQSQDVGQALAEFRGTQNDFPDPHGTAKYVIGGKTYSWQGRGRDIGVTVMKPGDSIKLYYNPGNPQEINTLVLLGLGTGSILLAAALAFLVFYVWFFWLRGFLRRAGAHDFHGDAPGSSADRASDRISSQIERSRSTLGDQHPVAINARPAENSFGRSGAVTFGKR